MKKILQQYSVHIVSVILILSGFIVTSRFIGPAPPDTITIATGSEQGAYFQYALQYQKILARDGIHLKIIKTAGSIENFKRLQAEENHPDMAFIQGGIGSDNKKIASLGSMYYEPVWLFYRKGIDLNRLTDLKNKKIAVGESGSGTQALARHLLSNNNINEKNTGYLQLDINDSVAALISARADAMFLVASAKSPVIKKLIVHPDISVFNMQRAEAYSRIYPYLSTISLPQGILDFAGNLPPSDVSMLATTANLAVHPDMHPALIGLMMQAASEVHGGHGLFNRAGRFPTAEFSGFPLNKEAQRYYNYGPSFLHRYLPFWAANLIDRLKIMLLPFLGLLIPLVKVFPPFYRWRIRKRIYRWYSELRLIDIGSNQLDTDNIENGLIQLSRIEDEVRQVEVPLSYADELYGLRLHLEMVRRKLQESG